MGCCLLALLGAIWPRLALAYVYLFVPAIPQKVFQTTLWPLLGFLILPTTTLAYELCKFYWGPIEGNIWSMILLFVAFLHDLGQLGATRRRRRA